MSRNDLRFIPSSYQCLKDLRTFMTNSDLNLEIQNMKRPKLVTTLTILVFAFSLIQLFSFSQVVFQWDILADLPLTSKPIQLALYRLAWCVSGIYLSIGLWTGKSWARIGGMAYGTLFCVISWIRLIWFIESSTLYPRWPVNLVYTCIGLGALIVILNLKSTRTFFERNTVKIP